ncbi:MAG: dienelactone hydrolase family protein [Azospirillaceae bacterium]|nr:dienelactone hydrolase family protein [Azospirillaceae bacterium]
MTTRLLRFVLLILFGTMLASHAIRAETDPDRVMFSTAEGPVTAQRFAVPGPTKRPAVIILHGRQGPDRFAASYQHAAAALAASGFDAYLLRYYSDSDAAQTANPSAPERQAVFDRRLPAWSRLVSDVVGDLLAQSSDRIGVLGFSQGGFLAAAAASQDPRIAAIVVYYGGNPLPAGQITRLPPLLELHGDADRVVPLLRGQALVDLAQRLGQSATMVVYPGAGHGFAGADAADARQRMLAFFQEQLRPATPRP